MKHPNTDIGLLLVELASPALASIDLSLDRVRALLADLGNPQGQLPPVVHVAGTNGKGSLLAYLAAMLRAGGYKAHRYISPHLVRFNERIELAGREISDKALLPLLLRVAKHTERHPVTFFEATTALAFLAFAETPADIVLLETGLGGRLDATNLVDTPLLTAITPVSLDHMEYLGKTLAAIAGEKAGIIKPKTPCVVGPQVPSAAKVIERAAAAARAPLMRFGSEWEMTATASGFHYRSATLDAHFPVPGLAGAHQLANAATAVACAERMKGFALSREAIARGIREAEWPARLERLTSGSLAVLLPPEAELWLDGGHNPAAGQVLAQWVRGRKKPVHLICGMLKSKDTVAFLKPLAPHIKSLTPVAITGEPSGQTPEMITEAAKDAGIKEITPPPAKSDMKKAIERIVRKGEKDCCILVCGSLYLAGNILWQNGKSR